MPQKSKSSKVSSKKGNYVKNPAPDDDPQNLANDSPISEEQTDRIGETGSVLTTHKDCVLHCLTIIGQIEGHYILSQQNKTTKYEHVIPLLVSVEEDERIDGLLVLINTVGGDVEAGLAIAEVISGMKKPTVSIVLGGGHSIGIPLAVAAKKSFIAKSASMTVHPLEQQASHSEFRRPLNIFSVCRTESQPLLPKIPILQKTVIISLCLTRVSL